MIDHRPMTVQGLGMPLLLTSLLASVFFLAACGQVITPEPTHASFPVYTPTVTVVTPGRRSITRAPSSAPPDTVTPTITPTPIVHVVQQGDTLQAIAFDFGVSVEALQRQNGIENPQFLQVGQRLIIPVGDGSRQTTPGLLLPTPTPHPIQAQGVAFYETPVGSLLGLGEVANTTPITLTNVQLRVTLLNHAGEPLVETNTFVSMDILPPRAHSPFNVLFTTPPSDWVSYQATVIRGQEAGALSNAYVPISVLRAEGNPSGSQFQVNGAVANVSAGRMAASVDIIVTTYDAEGMVTGFRRSELALDAAEEGLPPGEEATFSVSLTTHGGVPDDFAVTASGRAADRAVSGG